MADFSDNISKRIIREQWYTPIIDHLNKKLGYKLIYLGLPGPDAIDLCMWLPYIDEIIAFQCRDYPRPSSITQPKTKIKELADKLITWERSGLIKRFALYDGYIEEIVLNGRDLIGSTFSQNDVITIYNLDFCNSITQPQIMYDNEGKRKELFKTEVIRKLIEMQRDILSTKYQKKFVMFLTIHSNFSNPEISRFVSSPPEADVKNYFDELNAIPEHDKNMRILRAYIFYCIGTFFRASSFIADFLPVIYYKGAGRNYLMAFTILGTYQKTPSSVADGYQSSGVFCKSKFLIPVDDKLKAFEYKNYHESDCIHMAIDALTECKSYKTYWKT